MLDFLSANVDKQFHEVLLLEWLSTKLFFWAYFIVVGIAAACTSLSADLATAWLHNVREQMFREHAWAPISMRIAWTVALAGLAHGCVRLGPKSAGSGISELKMILSSATHGSILAFLSPITLVCKLVGIVLVTGAGLSSGREGPFVHISCCIAFGIAPRWIRDSPRHLATALRAAAAAGVSFTFGAPIGGLLFASEVSVTYFRLGHLPRALICALSGLLAVSWLNYGSLSPFKARAVEPAHELCPKQAAATVGLGVVCAVFAVAFNCSLKQLMRLKELHMRSLHAELGSVLLVAVLTAVVTSPGGPWHLLSLPASSLLPALLTNSASLLPGLLADDQHLLPAQLTNASGAVLPQPQEAFDPAPSVANAIGWLLAGACKLALTALTVSLPIPCGVFIPTFIAGAFVGRAWSTVLAVCFGLSARPGSYALIGAAALSGSVTGTISTCIIALELTGLSAGEASPLALACVFSIALRGLAVPGAYDVLMSAEHRPRHELMTRHISWDLPRHGGGDGNYSPNAGELMRTVDPAVPRVEPIADLQTLADAAERARALGTPLIAVVTRHASCDATSRPSDEKLVGAVSAKRLWLHCRRLRAEREGSDGRPMVPYTKQLTASLLGSEPSSEEPRRLIDLRDACDPAPLLDCAPFVVPAELSLRHLIGMFQMLDISQCFVNAEGWYLGTLTREGLSSALSSLDVDVSLPTRPSSLDLTRVPSSSSAAPLTGVLTYLRPPGPFPL